jgi:hypothetical protein
LNPFTFTRSSNNNLIRRSVFLFHGTFEGQLFPFLERRKEIALLMEMVETPDTTLKRPSFKDGGIIGKVRWILACEGTNNGSGVGTTLAGELQIIWTRLSSNSRLKAEGARNFNKSQCERLMLALNKLYYSRAVASTAAAVAAAAAAAANTDPPTLSQSDILFEERWLVDEQPPLSFSPAVSEGESRPIVLAMSLWSGCWKNPAYSNHQEAEMVEEAKKNVIKTLMTTAVAVCSDFMCDDAEVKSSPPPSLPPRVFVSKKTRKWYIENEETALWRRRDDTILLGALSSQGSTLVQRSGGDRLSRLLYLSRPS